MHMAVSSREGIWLLVTDHAIVPATNVRHYRQAQVQIRLILCKYAGKGKPWSLDLGNKYQLCLDIIEITPTLRLSNCGAFHLGDKRHPNHTHAIGYKAVGPNPTAVEYFFLNSRV